MNTEKRKRPSVDPKTINLLAKAYPDTDSFNKRVLKCLSDKREYENQNKQLREANEHHKRDIKACKEILELKSKSNDGLFNLNNKLIGDQKYDKEVIRQAKEQNRKLRTTVRLLSFCLVCVSIIAVKLAAS